MKGFMEKQDIIRQNVDEVDLPDRGGFRTGSETEPGRCKKIESGILDSADQNGRSQRGIFRCPSLKKYTDLYRYLVMVLVLNVPLIYSILLLNMRHVDFTRLTCV